MGNFFSHLFGLWRSPRQTMRAVLSGETPEWQIWVMVGFMMLLSFALGIIGEIAEGEVMAVGAAVVPFVITFILYLLLFYVGSAIYYGLGRWLCGGTGTYKSCRTAIAWCTIGFLPVAVVFGLLVAFVPVDALMILFTVLYVVAALWYTIVVYNMMAEGHGLPSAWQAFGMVMTMNLSVVLVLFIVGGLVAFAYKDVIMEQLQTFMTQMMLVGADLGSMGGLDALDAVGGLEGLENLGELDLEGIDLGEIDLTEVNLEDLGEIDQADVDAFRDAQ